MDVGHAWRAQVLTELGPSDYFGERGLLYNEPRGANVLVPSKGPTLRCLQASKAAFEEVLGPLQEIIMADSRWRVQAFLVRQLRKIRSKLKDVTIESFDLEGPLRELPRQLVKLRRMPTRRGAQRPKSYPPFFWGGGTFAMKCPRWVPAFRPG